MVTSGGGNQISIDIPSVLSLANRTNGGREDMNGFSSSLTSSQSAALDGNLIGAPLHAAMSVIDDRNHSWSRVDSLLTSYVDGTHGAAAIADQGQADSAKPLSSGTYSGSGGSIDAAVNA